MDDFHQPATTQTPLNPDDENARTEVNAEDGMNKGRGVKGTPLEHVQVNHDNGNAATTAVNVHKTTASRTPITVIGTTTDGAYPNDMGEEGSDDEDYGLFTLLPNYAQLKAKTDSFLQGHATKRWRKLAVSILLGVGYLAYFYAVLAIKTEMEGFNYWCEADGLLIILTFCVGIGMSYFLVIKPYYGRSINNIVLKPVYKAYERAWSLRWVRWALYLVLTVAVGAFLIWDTIDDSERLQSVFGVFVLLLFGFTFSRAPGKVRWRHVVWGMLLQFVLGLIILRWPLGRAIFQCLAGKVSAFLATTDAGSNFVFGDLAAVMHIFAFTILYYLGVMQWVVLKLGWLLQVTVGTTVCESVNASANIFLGMTEAPLMIKPFVPLMTKSEIHAVMTGGFATVAGSVLAAYISFGVDPVHLLSASVMSAPAALAFAKLFYPETRKSRTGAQNLPMLKGEEANMIHAAMIGVANAIPLVATIAGNLIAFNAIIDLLNKLLNWVCNLVGTVDQTCTMENVFGWIFMPLAWVMGVQWSECDEVGQLIAWKTIINEFVAYAKLAEMMDEGILSKRSIIISTYALCGFSNIGSIGITLGGLGAMVPSRRMDMAKVALRAMIAGSCSCFLTACITARFPVTAQMTTDRVEMTVVGSEGKAPIHIGGGVENMAFQADDVCKDLPQTQFDQAKTDDVLVTNTGVLPHAQEEDYSLLTFLPNYLEIKTKLKKAIPIPESQIPKYKSIVLSLVLLVAYLLYFIAVLIITTKAEVGRSALGLNVIKRFFGAMIYRTVIKSLDVAMTDLLAIKWVPWVVGLLLLVGVAVFLGFDAQDDVRRFQGLIGLVVLILFGFVFSIAPRKIRWRHVIWGLMMQFTMGLFILRWPLGQQIFTCLAGKVATFLSFTDAGTSFVFGDLVSVQHIFAFSILYYFGVMQWVVLKLGWMLQVTIGTTACESVNAAANIFLGQTEAPLLIKPYIPMMTKSELHAVMTGGFATIAGSVMAAYISLGVDPAQLLSASVMNAPGALAYSKLFYPETEPSSTSIKDIKMEKGQEANCLHAAMVGVTNAIPLVANIAANLIAFYAFISFCSYVFDWSCTLAGAEEGVCTLDNLFGWIFTPLAWVMGVEWSECGQVGQLIGVKIIVNEFVAYSKLAEMMKNGEISKRASTIATYALCGFSNISSIGINLGGFGAMAPERKGDLAKVVVRAMIAGSCVCFLTACIAGTLLTVDEDVTTDVLSSTESYSTTDVSSQYVVY
ncbi:Solute carrier family 28 member 3-like 1 [Homarus americanus]|uniref:Solute carrier family 28 member 3-like 1 n=1 Tax=Homarus americanus TaxID=6706 RepID=A0A8J5MWN4_HOMAM|nr:Solute carrier family 28 member 3-like 1 [Homarus americanus]